MKQNGKIPLIIIEIPGMNRAKPLLNILRDSEIFEIIIFPAIMYEKYMENWEVNHGYLRAIYGRTISDGEIGCAISHLEAQKMLSRTASGGVIMEDDARIENLNNLEELVSKFLVNSTGTSSLLSLLPWKHLNKFRLEVPTDERIIYKLWGQTPLTVGYALTNFAAKELSESNQEIKYLPDWPMNRVKFYTTIIGLICHGDGSTKSVIGTNSIRQISLKNKLTLFSGLSYIKNRDFFQNMAYYIKVVHLPAIYWKFDNLYFSHRCFYSKFDFFHKTKVNQQNISREIN